MATSEVYDMVRKLEEKAAFGPMAQEQDLAARLANALLAGDKIIACKEFSAKGKKYSPGDVFDTSGIQEQRLTQLARHRFIIPKSVYDQGRRSGLAREFLTDKVMPKYRALETVKTDLAKAAAQAADLESKLRAARAQLADAQARVKSIEAEISDILTGPELESILK